LGRNKKQVKIIIFMKKSTYNFLIGGCVLFGIFNVLDFLTNPQIQPLLGSLLLWGGAGILYYKKRKGHIK